MRRNLDAQHRQLADAEDAVERLLAGDYTATAPEPVDSSARTYDDLTAANDERRDRLGWGEVDLDAALSAEQHAALEAWQQRQRIRWGTDDVVAVGLAGAVGLVATWFDGALDTAVRNGLGKLADTDLLKGWERDAKQLPIDYTGPDFGGPGHRLRSAGHDLGRPVEALRQIREGMFRGSRFADNIHETVSFAHGTPVESFGGALTVWAKHLAADVVTPMSLPLPGFSKLYEIGGKDLRRFVHNAYEGGLAGGRANQASALNIRSGLMTPGLAVLSTEAIIRTHVHGRAWNRTGSAELTATEHAQRSELLLAGHAMVGAASLGKVAARSMLDGVGPLAIRHVNVPVLLRIGMLSLQVVGDGHRRRTSGAASWDELFANAAQPWQLPAAVDIENQTAALLNTACFTV